MLMAYPTLCPILNGPGLMLLMKGPGVSEARENRLVKMKGRIAARYERVERTTNEPTKAENAVVEPT